MLTSTNTVISLILLCCRRIAQLIHLVDSLDGVPDHLGQIIFQTISREARFDHPLFRDAFALFASAYREQFLASLDIYTKPVLISLPNLIEALPLCQSLTSLSIDNCELGWCRDQEAVSRLGQLMLSSSLVRLSLRRNNLTDDSIRSLTAPSRYASPHGQLVSRLQCLDLSGNGYVSERILKWFKPLSSLIELHLDDTGFVELSELPKTFSSDWQWVRRPMCKFYNRNPHPQGWFAQAVSDCLPPRGQLFDEKLKCQKPLKLYRQLRAP